MKNRIKTYFKNIIGTLFSLLILSIIALIYLNGSICYYSSSQLKNLHREGPYVFYENDSLLSVQYIEGNPKEGFSVDKTTHSIENLPLLKTHFNLDSSSFSFRLKNHFDIPKSTYNDNEPILAISDIESGYKTFRDFLIQNKVIDENLKWTFKKGHLVLVGDFVDRGSSTTQTLWFIYKLEQEAKKYGGNVHFIIGNHELKNLQGNYKSAAYKYRAVANILEKQQYALYDKHSFFGKWLASKNVIEKINGYLFTHGGIPPKIIDYNIDLDTINHIVREHYFRAYYPSKNKGIRDFLTSTKTGICWYRGYFKNKVTQEDIKSILSKYNANAIIVGHTIQRRVKSHFDHKVFAIDVKHPKDYEKHWPIKKSEGLWIDSNKEFRVTSTAIKEL